MGKTLKASVLLVPMAVFLMYFGGSGFDPSTVRNQRVLITGASSGIGEQLAYQYARLGARLVITARREGLLRNVSRTCMDLGAQEVHYVTADMDDSDGRLRVLAHAEKHFHGGLDHFILNHAILSDKWWTGSPENLTTLKQVVRVNFLSYVDLASKALPMLTASRGRIGIMSSGFGQFGTVRSSVYSASKFALHGFFSALRQELRHKNAGVSVTLMVLGPVATDSFLKVNQENLPNDCFAAPDDVARAVLESVSLRLYNVRFDWRMRGLLLINDFFPAFSEDTFSSFVLSENTTLLPRMMRFLVHTFY